MWCLWSPEVGYARQVDSHDQPLMGSCRLVNILGGISLSDVSIYRVLLAFKGCWQQKYRHILRSGTYMFSALFENRTWYSQVLIHSVKVFQGRSHPKSPKSTASHLINYYIIPIINGSFVFHYVHIVLPLLILILSFEFSIIAPPTSFSPFVCLTGETSNYSSELRIQSGFWLSVTGHFVFTFRSVVAAKNAWYLSPRNYISPCLLFLSVFLPVLSRICLV